MLIDTARLDDTLVSSYLTPQIVKSQWTKLRAPVRGSSALLRPDVLLFAQGRGLMVPTAWPAKSITAMAGLSHEERGTEDMKDGELAREAAYVLFGQEILEDRSKEQGARDRLIERFETERERVCEGTVLLS